MLIRNMQKRFKLLLNHPLKTIWLYQAGLSNLQNMKEAAEEPKVINPFKTGI